MRRWRGATDTLEEFFQTEAAGGVLLVVCACAALVVANSGLADAYDRLLATKVMIAGGEHALSLTVHHWINDGLMAIFFLLVGLEIKREVLVGELAAPRQAALPIAAAIGGMAVPALVYVFTNGGGPEARGWAIPMATDIAFALGVLALVAPRAPRGLRLFLAALAIVDDLGAVVVIAFFYSGAIDWRAVGIAGLLLLPLIALNLLRVQRMLPYLALGLGLWYFVHESGVHATIAGVLLAFVIPTRAHINATKFSAKARDLLDEFDRSETGDLLVLTSKGQQEAIARLERASERAVAPLLRLEHALRGFTVFVVMPLFALANAGVVLRGSAAGRVALAVIMGLVIGKPLGITVAALAAIRLRLATLPSGVSWTAIHGCAWLGGIGFTMSLFIAALAFDGTTLLESAKVGILGGSILSGVAGAVIVRRGVPSGRSVRRRGRTGGATETAATT